MKIEVLSLVITYSVIESCNFLTKLICDSPYHFKTIYNMSKLF